MNASTIGLDLGTSGVRAIVLDHGSGEVLASASRPVAVHNHAGTVTSNAEEIIEAVLEVLGRVGRASESIAGVGISVQGEAVLPVDADGRPVGPVVLSQDTRGAAVAERVAGTLGAERFQQITGQPLHPMFSGFKIAAGGEFATGWRGLGDHVLAVLGGRWVTDWTQAARTGLFDVNTLRWSDELAAALGLTDRDHPLPCTAVAGTRAGTIDPAVAAGVGLSPGTQLTVGAHDQAAAFLGGGGDQHGIAVLSLGSSEASSGR